MKPEQKTPVNSLITTLALMICLLMTNSGSCQDSSVRAIQQDGTTYAMLSPISVDSAISKLRKAEFFQRETFRLKEVNDSLISNINDQREVSSLWRNEATLQRYRADKYEALSENLSESRDSYKLLYRTQRNRKGFWKGLSIALGVFIAGKELKLKP